VSGALSTSLRPLSLAVVGVRYANKDKARSDRGFEIALCKPGEPVELRPEPKNRHDRHAIAVFSVRGIQLGYLTAERAPRIGALLRSREVAAVFQAPAPHGAWIRVAFDGEAPSVPAAPPPTAKEPEFYPDEDFGWPDD
jgi:hypothetical protein